MHQLRGQGELMGETLNEKTPAYSTYQHQDSHMAISLHCPHGAAATLGDMTRRLAAAACFVLALASLASAQALLQSRDFFTLRSVGAVRWSPDGTRIAYVVTNNDGPGRPYSQLWLLTVATSQSMRVGDDASRGRRAHDVGQ